MSLLVGARVLILSRRRRCHLSHRRLCRSCRRKMRRSLFVMVTFWQQVGLPMPIRMWKGSLDVFTFWLSLVSQSVVGDLALCHVHRRPFLWSSHRVPNFHLAVLAQHRRNSRICCQMQATCPRSLLDRTGCGLCQVLLLAQAPQPRLLSFRLTMRIWIFLQRSMSLASLAGLPPQPRLCELVRAVAWCVHASCCFILICFGHASSVCAGWWASGSFPGPIAYPKSFSLRIFMRHLKPDQGLLYR